MPQVLRVEILQSSDDMLVCRLHCTYPFAGYDFVESPTLALQIVWDAWDRMAGEYKSFKATDDRSEFGIFCPFSADDAARRVEESGISFYLPTMWDKSWFEENAKRFILWVSVSEREN